MIVDSSAVMAVLEGEPDADRVLELLAEHPARMSVATWVEVSIVADSRSPRHGSRLDQLLAELRITIEPVTPEQGTLARLASRRYGRGSGSPARLNYGDCFAYALAISRAEPLLFVGEDFTDADIVPALCT